MMVQKALFPAIIKEAENCVSFARNLSKNIILFPQLLIFQKRIHNSTNEYTKEYTTYYHLDLMVTYCFIFSRNHCSFMFKPYPYSATHK